MICVPVSSKILPYSCLPPPTEQKVVTCNNEEKGSNRSEKGKKKTENK